MANFSLTINKATEEITMQDIITLVKGNHNTLETVINSIQNLLQDKVQIQHFYKDSYKVIYNNSTIIIGNHYNPYPTRQCYVL